MDINMLKRFEVENFKNFKDKIVLDFGNTGGYQFSSDCLTNGIISKMLIYGRNATGKTNLGKAIWDIVPTFLDFRFFNEGVFLNADSSNSYAKFSYTFQFEENEIKYEYTKFTESYLRDEQLIINNKKIFRCDFFNNKCEFDNLSYISADTINVDRYLESLKENDNSEDINEVKLPFLRWMVNNAAFTNDSPVLKLADYIKRMVMLTVGNALTTRERRFNDSFFESLEDPEQLKLFEEFLNMMGVECKLNIQTLPDGQKQLYFAHNKLVPFYENASSGTLALVNLYRKFVMAGRTASLMYLDEFDAFYHYEMAESVIRFFKKIYPNCQIIMTSHNTNLMTNRLMRPDCLFILSRKGELTALCDATFRELREGHNLEKMYISGEFEKYE